MNFVEVKDNVKLNVIACNPFYAITWKGLDRAKMLWQSSFPNVIVCWASYNIVWMIFCEIKMCLNEWLCWTRWECASVENLNSYEWNLIFCKVTCYGQGYVKRWFVFQKALSLFSPTTTHQKREKSHNAECNGQYHFLLMSLIKVHCLYDAFSSHKSSFYNHMGN